MAKALISSSKIVLFFILCSIFIVLITQVTSQPQFEYYFCEGDKGNFSRNITYEDNLNHLMSTLPSQEGNGYGFYNLSYGNASDKVYAIALCRGDVNPIACRICLNDSTHYLRELCPDSKEAIGWYDNCMLRYANRSMYGVWETSPTFTLRNGYSVPSEAMDRYFEQLNTLLEELKNRAAAGGSLRKFATGNATAPESVTIYVLVQCMPELSQQGCRDCLDGLYGFFPNCCGGKRGGRVGGPSCKARYEEYPFYGATVNPPPPPPPLPTSPPLLSPTVSPLSPMSTHISTTQGKESNTSKTVIIAVVSSSALFSVVLIISVFVFLRIKREKQKEKNRPIHGLEEIESAESGLQYNFDTIRVATDNFSEANKLGQGGFGSVYKGRLSNGEDIAVKRLAGDSEQGDLEFKNEVVLVAKLQHRNLVRLLGFCLERNERLLVFEFVPNASLDHFIFRQSARANLDWNTRYKIIGGISRGLLYLHEDSRVTIIHRDLKASNILLDEEMNPKIADFGTARLFLVDQTQSTNRIVGTYGYMAPEYAMHGHFSVKSDVFSFGVLILEIVSGQKNNCFRHGEHAEHLLSYAWINWRKGTSLNVADPLLGLSSGPEIMRCIHIALLCVQEDAAERPTMNKVVHMLNSNSSSFPMPTRPGYFSMHANTGSDASLASDLKPRVVELNHPKSESVQASVNEASITELYPR